MDKKAKICKTEMNICLGKSFKFSSRNTRMAGKQKSKTETALDLYDAQWPIWNRI